MKNTPMNRCHFLREGVTFLLVSYFDFSKWNNNKICINSVQYNTNLWQHLLQSYTQEYS